MLKTSKKCKAAEGCTRDALKMEFCNTHYAQVKRGIRSSKRTQERTRSVFEE